MRNALLDRVSFTPGAVAPFIVVEPTAPQTVYLGDSVVLIVVAGGTPSFYQWQHNGTNLLGATGASLLIASAQTNDSGFYRVTVWNTAGAVVTLRATERPAF